MASTSDAHYVRQPPWLFWIRITQSILALIVLALSAFAVATLWDIAGTFGFNIFCSIYTWIVVAYLLVTSTKFVHLWNMWAALVLDIFGVLFWISAWGSMAGWAALYNIVDTASTRTYSSWTSSYSDYFDKRDLGLVKRYTQADIDRQRAAWKCVAAAAAMGAIIWVLFVISLVTYSISLHRHRRDPANVGLPKDGRPVKEGEVGESYGPDKMEMHPVQQQGQVY